ncbi:hypothetical protein D3C78_1166980 [compost metagenome]
MADEVGHGVDVVVAQRRGLLGRLELGGQGEGRLVPALDAQDLVEGVALAGTGVADVDALALEVVEAGDLGVAAGEDGEHLALQGEHRADVVHRAFGLERRFALHRLVLVVGLHDAEVEFTAADAVDVGHAAAAGRGVALDLVLGRAAVEEPADRLAGHVVDAGLAAGADGDELVLCLNGAAQREACQCCRQGPCQGFAFHGGASFF